TGYPAGVPFLRSVTGALLPAGFLPAHSGLRSVWPPDNGHERWKARAPAMQHDRGKRTVAHALPSDRDLKHRFHHESRTAPAAVQQLAGPDWHQILPV